MDMSDMFQVFRKELDWAGRKLIPSGWLCPVGYGPSVQPTRAQMVGAKSMFWSRVETLRRCSPRPSGQLMIKGSCVA